MNDQGTTVNGLPGGASYAAQAALFIADVERFTALGLPVLPEEDPAEAAVMRAAGYDVLAECASLAGTRAIVSVTSEDDELHHSVSAADLAAALGVTELALLPGQVFVATLRETPADGRVLSGFRLAAAAK